ncbi:MAG: metallophosphoesterase [Chloroflexi bacterium]|nr:metallophosphoesterase [Chloroflexota bacterium]
MRIWAIADLHLSFAMPKPMDVFGERWRDHPQRVAAAWRDRVAEDDVVLIAGDNSWALKLPEALVDLRWIAELPGHKVLTKGNHDYWWDSARKRRAELPPRMMLIEADAIECGDWVLCGTRAWLTPGHPSFSYETDERIYNRELGRLERALAAAQRISGGAKPIGVLLHYPPFYPDGKPTEFAKMISAAGASFCVYGHLHRRADWNLAVQGPRDGVRYHLTSCDFLQFVPSLIVDEHGHVADRSFGG